MTNVSAYPKVSIIMPTYNRAGFIHESIDSIRRQTYANWDLIIVDDGSEDETEQIVSRFNDERINFLKAGRVGINGKVKNIGLKQAKGDLFAFIDSDDLWAETKLEKQVKALQEFGDAGFSFTGGFNFKKIDEPIDFFYKVKDGFRYGNILVPIFKSEISTTTPSLMIRRHCLQVVGGFDETKPFSDVNFFLRLASHFNAVILYEPLLYRRLHDNNDSGNNWVLGYDQGISMIREYETKLPRRVARNALFKLYVNFGEDYLTRKKTGQAIKKFFLAWTSNPLSVVPFKKSAKAVLHWAKQ
jgi:glycosyltransferase involved in cell wall biosynthesis